MLTRHAPIQYQVPHDASGELHSLSLSDTSALAHWINPTHPSSKTTLVYAPELDDFSVANVRFETSIMPNSIAPLGTDNVF